MTADAPAEVSPAELAERIADKVGAVPDVAGLTAGPRGRVVTYRVGRPVVGVAVRDDAVEVGVVARQGGRLADVGDAVRAVVGPMAGGRTVDVLIGDIEGEADG
ncbi:hypothetical protein [Spirillospora sp. CA-294931]|uniref:hypothetical protein n=1 Tax=Spirillospora sp. CA-294931 TaxID=3240042 RepID=UPI003D8B2CAC